MAAPHFQRLAALSSHLSSGPQQRSAANPPAAAAGAGVGAAEVRAHEESIAAAGRGWEMSDEELYLFDTMGFLRVRNVLDQETVALAIGRKAILTKSAHEIPIQKNKIR